MNQALFYPHQPFCDDEIASYEPEIGNQSVIYQPVQQRMKTNYADAEGDMSPGSTNLSRTEHIIRPP